MHYTQLDTARTSNSAHFPNQIEWRHYSLLSASTTYVIIKRHTRITKLLTFTKMHIVNCLPPSLLDHFVEPVSQKVIHEQ